MRARRPGALAAVATAAALALVPAPPAAAQSAPPFDQTITVDLEGLIIGRDNYGGGRFTRRTPGAGVPYVRVGPNDDRPGLGWGFRANVEIRPPGGDVGLQIGGIYASGFETAIERSNLGDGVAGVSTNAVYEGAAGQDISFPNGDRIFALRANQTTRLYGGEVNVSGGSHRFELNQMNVLAGVRFLAVDETLGMRVFDEADDFSGADNDIDRLNIDTQNHLVGLQFGLSGELPVTSLVSLAGFAKGGLYANLVSRTRDLQALDAPGTRVTDTSSGAAFATMLELSPRMIIRSGFWDRLVFTAGGDFIFLTGMSTATSYARRAADLDDQAIRRDGSIIFYGATVGLTLFLN